MEVLHQRVHGRGTIDKPEHEDIFEVYLFSTETLEIHTLGWGVWWLGAWHAVARIDEPPESYYEGHTQWLTLLSALVADTSYADLAEMKRYSWEDVVSGLRTNWEMNQ